MSKLRQNNIRLWPSLVITVAIASPLLYVLTRHPTSENVLPILILSVLLPIFLIDYELGFLAILVLRPAMDSFSQYSILELGQLSLNLSSVVSLLVMAWIALYLLKKGSRFWRQPLFWPFLVFVALSSLSLVYTPSVTATLREVVRVASIFFMYLMAGELISNRVQFTRSLKAIGLSLIIPLAVGCYQFITGAGLSFAGTNNRIYGTLAHPNALAEYLVLALGIGFSYLLSQEKPRRRPWLIVGLVVVFIFLLLTYTRGSWIGFIIVFIIFGLRYYRKILLGLALLSFAIVIFGPIINRLSFTYLDYDFSRNQLIQRLTDKDTDAESSIDWRFQVWKEMSRKITDRPLLGYGLGAFPVIRQQYVKGFFESTEAHNDYLRLVIELGLIGMASYLILLGKLVFNIYRRYRQSRVFSDKAWLLGGLALCAAYIFISSSDNLLQGTAMMWAFWSMMAVLQKLPSLK